MQDHPTTRMYFICWPLELSHADGRRSSGAECNERQFVRSFRCIFAANLAISCGGIHMNCVHLHTSPHCSCDEITVESPLPATCATPCVHCGRKLSELRCGLLARQLWVLCLCGKGRPTFTPAYRGFVTRLDCEYI